MAGMVQYIGILASKKVPYKCLNEIRVRGHLFTKVVLQSIA